jgi:hypothetical protein
MKVLINNSWIELSIFTGIMFGIAKNDDDILIMVGPFAVVINTRAMMRKSRKGGPQKF